MNTTPKPKKLLDQVRDVLRVKHYAYRTEKTCIFWIRRFILFHEKKHPSEMGSRQIQDFLTHLAVKRNVSASTQNQALNALIFLYKKVLRIDLRDPIEAVRARRPTRLPVVLSKPEAFKIIDLISGESQLIVKLLYGSGLRLMECLRLRVKDIDFSMNQILVRHGKGGKDRVTVLPANVTDSLQMHLKKVRAIHEDDCRRLRHSHGTGATRHKDVSTTMIYTHVLNKGGRAVRSPID